MTGLRPVDGGHVVPGMVLVDAAGVHEVDWVGEYPGRFVGPDGERAHVAHFVDGGCRIMRDNAVYQCRAA